MESTYEEIQASVFCNKIRKMERTIDNNLDKMYFLKQYFKNFDYTLSKRHSLLSKKITLNH